MAKILVALLIGLSGLYAQWGSFSRPERVQGYAHRNDTTYFIFDEEVYQVQPDKVIVEGGMRDWDHDLNDPRWHLRPNTAQSGLWYLAIPNPDMQTVVPRTPFKYRINDGQWLDPPARAGNIESGNLIFAAHIKPLTVEAEMVSSRDIRVRFPNQKPDYRYEASLYKLTEADGNAININRVLYIEPGVLQLVPAQDVNRKRLYYVHTPYTDAKAPARYDGWFRHLYSDKELGANFYPTQNATYIRLFVPRADSVFLHLYLKPGEPAHSRLPMELHADGVWQTRLQGNWQGWYYDFTAFGPDEPGNHFYPTDSVHFSDPWGRVSVDSFGPTRIWPAMEPATPLTDGIPAMQDVVAYEVHVQDFTRNLPLPDSLKGTFKGFVTPGLQNAQGQAIGFDHLLDLDINVVHLMPVQEFLHYPDDQWQDAFANDPYMIEQGINNENYQWGYRTSHAFAIESRFRTAGSGHGAQNRQFRDLVQAFHDHGIAVIVDVVFNHTAERMDGRQFYFNFSAMDVPYFYRTEDRFDYIGEYGTETKSEERPMMQRWIIEQCTDIIEQYGIDGFRIDLAGQTDEQTLTALKEELGPDIIVYGEPWIASADPDYENNPDWDWYKTDSPITFFQDEARNAFKGPVSNPQNKATDRGYAGGAGNRQAVKKALSAGFETDDTPLSGINYLDIHDNWALADRFAQHNWDGRLGVHEDRYKIAATLLLTSLGPIVLHGGSEMMRSKGHTPLKEVIKYLNGKPLYFHGKRDTYNLAKANAFIWANKGLNADADSAVHCNYADMYAFWKRLITFRKSPHGRVFRIADKPDSNYYRWIEPPNKKLLGYIVDEKVFVLVNTDEMTGTFSNVTLPRGRWQMIATNDGIDYANGMNGGRYSVLSGQKSYSIELGGKQLRIWIIK
ncbi:MAG: pullulanase [Caldithrix sp.]|nr:pullulanase [Caldithrix sp.]